MADSTDSTKSLPESPTEDNDVSFDLQKDVKPKPVNSKRAKVALINTESSKLLSDNSPQQAVAKSLQSVLLKRHKPAKSSETAKPQNPTMLNMILEALKSNKSAKGLTPQGMKSYIAEKYPSTKESFSNVRFRKALLKGLEKNEVIRPKSSEETGLKGHFLFNRVLHSQKKEMKQPTSKIGIKRKLAGSEDDRQLKKKVSKTVTKKRPISKSPNPRSKSPNPRSKSPNPRSKSKNSETFSSTKSKPSKQKSTKSPKNESKTIPIKDKVAEKKSTPKKIPKSAAASKVNKSTKTTLTPKVDKPVKVESTPKLSKPTKATAASKLSKSAKATGTPKLSKSTKAGARQKTAVVKKLMKSTE